MDFVVDPTARSPLYRQIQDQIRYAISVGELVPGNALPSIRELEKRLDINRNTVRRAYLELQVEGTLLIRQGREAIVAERPPTARPADPQALGDAADALASMVLRRAESIGLDSVRLAEHLAEAARRHDATYPRCAFLECSARQADWFAAHAERHLGRHVVGVDLHHLRDDPAAIPSSVRFVLTPHWHAAEADELFRSGPRSVHPLAVRIDADCGRRLRALEGGEIGLVVRDPESLPGFRDRLQSHVGRPSIRAALSGQRGAVLSLLAAVDHVVCTSPCVDAVQALAPPGVGVHELLFEPVPEDLGAVEAEIFPALGRPASGQTVGVAGAAVRSDTMTLPPAGEREA